MRAFRLRVGVPARQTRRPFKPPLAAVGLFLGALILALAGAANEAVIFAGGLALLLAALHGRETA